MIRGVNKKVIEVLNPEGDYFEKVILFVKESKQHTGSRELQRRADHLIESYAPGKAAPSPLISCRRSRLRETVRMICAALIGAALSAAACLTLL